MRRVGPSLLLAFLPLLGLPKGDGQTPPPPAASPAAADVIADLKRQIDALSEKVQALQNAQEEQDREKAVAAQRQQNFPIVTAGANGFQIASPDRQFELKLKGLLQVDSREFLSPANNGSAPGDGIYVRRLRPILDGTLWGAYTFRLEPEFGARTGGVSGTSAFTGSVANAYVDVDYVDDLQLKVGRWKGPVGYERSQLVVNTIWIENGMPQNLTPQYDQAAMLHGTVDKGFFSWGAGAMQGVRDNANADVQSLSDNNLDFVGFLDFQPFKDSDNDALRGFGFGVGGSIGNRGDTQTAANSPLATYTTPGQTALLTYNTAGGAVNSEDGEGWRLSPDVYYYCGPLGAYAEYAVSSIEALRTLGAGRRTTTFRNEAWQVVASYVLTGENASYAGVVPRSNFSLKNHTWGAFQAVARYGELRLDSAYFDSFGPGVGAPFAFGPQTTRDVGIGLNWYLNTNIKAQLDFDHSAFSGGNLPVTPANEDNNVFVTQLQLAF